MGHDGSFVRGGVAATLGECVLVGGGRPVVGTRGSLIGRDGAAAGRLSSLTRLFGPFDGECDVGFREPMAGGEIGAQSGQFLRAGRRSLGDRGGHDSDSGVVAGEPGALRVVCGCWP